MVALAAALERLPNGDGLQRTVFTESHDLASAAGGGRVPAAVVPTDPEGWTARRRSALAAVFVLTAPGVPMLLQGQELLEIAPFDPAVPIDWSRAATQAGTLEVWRDLIALRRNLDGVSGGLRGASIEVHHVDDAAKLLAWHRWDQGGGADDVVVVANLTANRTSGVRIGFPQAGTWRVRFNGDHRTYGADYTDWGSVTVAAGGPPADGMPASGLVDLAGYTALVLSR
jgi:1,4-alpha-glucan branching enzyme